MTIVRLLGFCAIFLIAACESYGPFIPGRDLPPAPRSPAPVEGRPAGEVPMAPPPPEPVVRADCANMVPIDAATTREGIAKQYQYLGQRFPGYRVIEQLSTNCGAARVDVVSIRLQDGTTRVVTFDTSRYFGRTRDGNLDDLLDG